MPLPGLDTTFSDERVNLVGCVFGLEKRMKTSCMLAAFPNAIYFGDKDRLAETALVEYGIEPAIWPSAHCQDRLGFDIPAEFAKQTMELDDLFGAMAWLAHEIGPEELAASGIDSVGIDDISIQVASFLADLVEKIDQGPSVVPEAYSKEGGRSGWYHFNQLDNRLRRAIPLSRRLRCDVWMTAHEISDSVDPKTRKKQRGGADFGSRSQCGKVARVLSTLVRAEVDENWIDPYGARVIVRSSYRDPTWIVNDSNRALLDGGPLNIRAAVRASKRQRILSRHLGLEWQDDVMLAVADAIGEFVDTSGVEALTLEAMTDIAREFEARCYNGFDGAIPDAILELPHMDLYAQWGIQDGLAYWWYAREQKRSKLDTLNAPEAKKPTGATIPTGLPKKKSFGGIPKKT
mgnify:CR=1 FL=1